jgi:hypothetical protein
MFFSQKAEAQLQLNNEDNAIESMSKAQEIAKQHKLIPGGFVSYYLVSKFMLDIRLLKNAILSEDKQLQKKLLKKTYVSGKNALRKFRMYALLRPKVICLMGEYFWLKGKQGKAFKWWSEAIKDAEKLGSRLYLSRTYFEVGKSLLDPISKFKELNGITGEEYLDKARTMFEEMDLQRDLDELDRLMMSR